MAALTEARTSDPREDADLVAAARAGDDRAFETLYSRYRGRIVGYVHGMVGDWAKAEDVTQEVFISALRRMRETDRPIAFRPWVFEIAKNACIDQFRRSKRAQEVPIEGDDGLRVIEGGDLSGSAPASPESAADVSQQMENLRGAFGALSPSHHEILVLRELEGLSYREIGERMNLSRPGVESTLFRARRRLTEEYDELATGRRCQRIQGVLDHAATEGSLGTRERHRLVRHLAWCRSCRRDARLAGVDEGLVAAGTATKVGAWLPLPLVELLRRFRGSGRESSTLTHLASTAGPASDAGAAGWSKAAVAVAALVAGGAGAGAASHVDSLEQPAHPATPRVHHVRPAAAPARHKATHKARAAKRSGKGAASTHRAGGGASHHTASSSAGGGGTVKKSVTTHLGGPGGAGGSATPRSGSGAASGSQSSSGATGRLPVDPTPKGIGSGGPSSAADPRQSGGVTKPITDAVKPILQGAGNTVRSAGTGLLPKR